MIPKDAVEETGYSIVINELNSKQRSKNKLKNGMWDIGGNRFIIPFTYSLPMNIRDGIDILVGCNFIRANAGGMRIEGNDVTFYKNVARIDTRPRAEHAKALEVEGLELAEAQEVVYLNWGSPTKVPSHHQQA